MARKMTKKFLAAVYGKDKADKLLRIASENEYISAPDDYQMEIPEDGRKPFMKPTEPFSSMDQVYDEIKT